MHTLTGDRKGTWSLSVTVNRRLTFRIDTSEREIYDMNLEDYDISQTRKREKQISVPRFSSLAAMQ